jgi:ElaB/YqjD/DUF883 family membrane-anchored ribosome-binding protein
MTQENKSESQATKNPREIEAAIGETRNALTDDIRALSDKASPAHLKQEAKQALKNAKDDLVDKAVEKGAVARDVVVDRALEIKDIAVEKASEAKDLAVAKAQEAADVIAETADEVVTQTRDISRVAWQFTVDNAVPLGLIGIGAGLLLTNQRKSRRLAEASWDEENYLDYPDDYPADNLAFAADVDSPARVRPLATGPQRRRKTGATALKKAGKGLRQSSKSAYDKAEQGLEDAEHRLVDSAARGRDIVQDKIRNVSRASREFAEANPLALAFGTLLAGVGVGLLLPSTSREDALLRPARARIRGALGDARRVAEDVGNVAKETLRDSVATASSGSGLQTR